jgi:hypothetical protein
VKTLERLDEATTPDGRGIDMAVAALRPNGTLFLARLP